MADPTLSDVESLEDFPDKESPNGSIQEIESDDEEYNSEKITDNISLSNTDCNNASALSDKEGTKVDAKTDPKSVETQKVNISKLEDTVNGVEKIKKDRLRDKNGETNPSCDSSFSADEGEDKGDGGDNQEDETLVDAVDTGKVIKLVNGSNDDSSLDADQVDSEKSSKGSRASSEAKDKSVKETEKENKTNNDSEANTEGSKKNEKDSKAEMKSPLQLETRRRSLRTATRKSTEVQQPVTPTKAEKRKASDSSPRGKAKSEKLLEKKAKTEVEKVEEPKVVEEEEPAFEPMPEEILKDAKFPAYLNDLIALGCYIPIPEKKTPQVKLKEGESLLETPSLSIPLLLKKPDAIKSKEDKKDSSKEENKKTFQMKPFFTSTAGEFLIGIGVSRVNEWYEKDMIKVKQRQLKREGKSDLLEGALSNHKTYYLQAKQANDPFSFELLKCHLCNFQSESNLVMQGHFLTPHLTQRREFQCSFCSFITRDHKAILFHMEALHNAKANKELQGQFFYDCPFCPFETNLKSKSTSHINKCQKYFLSARNQNPPGEWENPAVTAKPITLADIKSYEMCVAAANAVARSSTNKNIPGRAMARGGLSQSRLIRPAPQQLLKNNLSPSNYSLYQQIVNQSLKESGLISNNALTIQKSRISTPYVTKSQAGKPDITVAVPGGQIFQVVNNGQVIPMVNPSSLTNSGSQFVISSGGSNPQSVSLFPNMASGAKNSISITPHNPALKGKRPTTAAAIGATASSCISPAALSKLQAQQANLPKLQGPYTTVQTASKSGNGNPLLANTTFVICEICDGYLKDLEQLRTHMLWIHKVKIHPKMLSSRPPLNCQKCQWRFFTDQGLERHLLGAHGLVTSNMQELANKNQDGGRCTVCGRVYVCKLVSHMNQVHKATLKPAHLSYKCTVCSATFNLYKLFENHVYMFHSGSVKRAAEDSTGLAKKKSQVSVPGKEVEVTVISGSKNSESNKGNLQRGGLPPPLKLPSIEVSSSPLELNNPKPPQPPPQTANLEVQLKKNADFAKEAVKLTKTIIGRESSNDDIKVCIECNRKVNNQYMHMRMWHTRKCHVKLCRIEKCVKCLCSFDGMVVLHTADFQEDESGDEQGTDNETSKLEWF